MSDYILKEYLFEYHYGRDTYGITVAAYSSDEAVGRMCALARGFEYKGEIAATIKVPARFEQFVKWITGAK